MDSVKKQYSESYKRHGNSLNAIFIPKGRQKERFDSLSNYINDEQKCIVLDFGCGLGHLKEYLAFKFNNITYEGCDIVEEFILQSKENFPDSTFYTINQYIDVVKEYDYIVAAGVFNLLYSPNVEEHFAIVQKIIEHLFLKTKKVLSINFMTDDVDFIALGGYHQNINSFCDYTKKNLTKRFVIDQSYMPYEFTIHLFKDDKIVRPDNIFNPL